MRGNRFDIPPGAKACRGQLVGAETLDQCSDRPPFVGYRREYPITFCPAQPHWNRILGKGPGSASMRRTPHSAWSTCQHAHPRPASAVTANRLLTWSGPRAILQVGQNRKLGGRVTAGNSPAHVYRRLFRADAASAQPPHMSMKLSISRTTSFLVYGRPYPRIAEATTEFSAQRSLTMAASTSSAKSAAIGDRGSGLPSRVCTRAAKVMLEISQTPWAATRSATRSAR